MLCSLGAGGLDGGGSISTVGSNNSPVRTSKPAAHPTSSSAPNAKAKSNTVTIESRPSSKALLSRNAGKGTTPRASTLILSGQSRSNLTSAPDGFDPSKAKKCVDYVLTHTACNSYDEFRERYMASTKLQESLKSQQSLADSRIAQLKIEHAELVESWNETNFVSTAESTVAGNKSSAGGTEKQVLGNNGNDDGRPKTANTASNNAQINGDNPDNNNGS